MLRKRFWLIFVIGFWCSMPFGQAQQLSVIVNNDNPIEQPTDKELINYFLKSKRVWPHGLKVDLVDFASGTPEKKVFLQTLLQWTEQEWQEHWNKMKITKSILQSLQVLSAKQAIDFVVFDNAAMAYVFTQDLSPEDLLRVHVVRTLER